jgi:tetratricopeptide (TPR) repeat protein
MNRSHPLLAAGICLAIALAFPAHAQSQDDATEAEPAAQGPALPAQALTPETLYTILLGEIAGARGEIGISVQAYLELARKTRDPRIARRATEIAMFARNAEAAAEAARIWVEVDPESEDARRVLAGVLAGGEGRLEEVQIQLARLLAQSPDQLEGHLMSLNRAFARVTNKPAARAIIDRLTEPYLDRPEAHFARAQAAITAEDAVGARTAIDGALGLRPDWEPAVLFKAQLLAQSGASAEAVELLKAHLARHPDDRNVRLVYARSLVSAREFEAARSEFRTLLASAPDDRDLLYAVGLLSAQVDDFEAAVPLLERALETGHPEADGIRLNLGQIAERREDPEGALRWYRAIETGRHHLDAQLRIASVLARTGRFDEAREHLRAVQGDEDTRKRLILAEAQLLRSADRDGEAFEVLDAALRQSPDDRDLLYESSMLAESLGKLDIMEGRLRKLIALHPDHAHAYNALGYSLADRGLRLDEAESMIARALELAPEDPFILDSMGWVRFRRGFASDALGHLEHAYRLRPDPEIAAHLGEVLWSMDRRDDATRVWDEALNAHPDNKVLAEAVQRLRGR